MKRFFYIKEKTRNLLKEHENAFAYFKNFEVYININKCL